MKLTQKQRRIIALILAFILIATGVIQIVFNIQLNQKITRFMETIILFAGFYLLFISPNKDQRNDKQESDNQENDEHENDDQESDNQENTNQENDKK